MLQAQLASEPLVARLESLSTVWEYELTLCTFVVTFFLNQVRTSLAQEHIGLDHTIGEHGCRLEWGYCHLPRATRCSVLGTRCLPQAQ